MAIHDGGLVDAADLPWLRELSSMQAGHMESGRVTAPGDRRRLGLALLEAWRAEVDRRRGSLDFGALVVLMDEPELLASLGHASLAGRLARGPYAVGALVTTGIATVRELRALRRMELIAVPELQADELPQSAADGGAEPGEEADWDEAGFEGELLLEDELSGWLPAVDGTEPVGTEPLGFEPVGFEPVGFEPPGFESLEEGPQDEETDDPESAPTDALGAWLNGASLGGAAPVGSAGDATGWTPQEQWGDSGRPWGAELSEELFSLPDGLDVAAEAQRLDAAGERSPAPGPDEVGLEEDLSSELLALPAESEDLAGMSHLSGLRSLPPPPWDSDSDSDEEAGFVAAEDDTPNPEDAPTDGFRVVGETLAPPQPVPVELEGRLPPAFDEDSLGTAELVRELVNRAREELCAGLVGDACDTLERARFLDRDDPHALIHLSWALHVQSGGAADVTALVDSAVARAQGDPTVEGLARRVRRAASRGGAGGSRSA